MQGVEINLINGFLVHDVVYEHMNCLNPPV